MNNRKLFFGIVTLSLFGSFVSPVFAQETTSLKPVTFKVTVGAIACTSGTGKSLVKFENTPMEGGYYEVTGEMINKNNIALSREVELPSGTYLWVGIPQSGYATTTASSGKFVVKECAKIIPTSTTKKEPTIETSSEPKENNIIPTTVSPEKTSAKETPINIIPGIQGDMQKKIAGGLFILVVIAGVFFWKRKGKKISEPSA